MNCVQCHEEMEGFYGGASLWSKARFTLSFGIGYRVVPLRPEYYRCANPKCPNFNLLQGEL